MRRTVITVTSLFAFATAAAVAACAESTDGAMPDSLPSGDAATDAAKAPSDAGAKGDAPLVTGDSSVLINEISASDEWVELVASGTTPADLSGFRVADEDKAGGPKLAEAATLPPGTVLSPHSYLLVQGGGLDGGGKPCPDGGFSYCVNAAFGISNKNGETLYLIDKAGAVVGTATYPPLAAAAGESWSRLPSGDPSGAFGKGTPTPGGPNVAR